MSYANYAQMGGMAAQAVGSAIQTYAAQKAADKMEDTYRKALTAQRGYRAQGGKVLGGRIDETTAPVAEQQIGEGAANRESLYAREGATPMGFVGAPTNSQMRDVAAGQLASKQRAQLGGYSDWALRQSISAVQAQDKLNQISSFAGGSAATVPYQMYDAQHAYDKLAMAGAILYAAGSGAAGSFNAGDSQRIASGGNVPQGPSLYSQPLYGGQSSYPSNWGDLNRGQQSDYAYMYNYYNNPNSSGYIAPGTFE